MSWQPTVGTLSAEELADHRYMLTDNYEPPTSEDVDAIWGHIDALTKQLERARGIAVNLEQELFHRGAGRWPMRQYATVELPDEAVDKAGAE